MWQAVRARAEREKDPPPAVQALTHRTVALMLRWLFT
jgi:hypothetical protein